MGSFSFQFFSRFIVMLLVAIAASGIKINSAYAVTVDFTVFDARKTLPLSDDEPVYRDYYVNMGVEAGVKIGSVLSVYRKIPLVDVYTNKAPGDLIVEVARIQVIHTQHSLSVGRVVSGSNYKSIPVVQYEKVMLGDRVDFAAVQTVAKKPDDDEVASQDEDDSNDLESTDVAEK
jgi:hypothetical protein